MGFFKREKENTPSQVEASRPAQIFQPTTTSISLRPASQGEMESAKSSVEEMMQELKDGADQQQIAAKRMSGLSQTIAKMEVGLRHMSRLESQCVQLENDLQLTRKKYIQKENWAKEQENKLANLARKHSELRQSLELADADIAARRDRETANTESLAAQTLEIEGLNTEIAARDNHVNELTMINTNLVNDVNDQSQIISKQGNRITELTKSLEEIASRLDSRTKEGLSLQADLGSIRIDHNELKSKYFEKLSELENVKYDLKTQRESLEDSLKRRDEEAYSLKARIEQLNTQVRIKQNMSGHLDEEILSLRTAVESEQGRTKRAEDRLRIKTDQADKAHAALLSTKNDYDILNRKFESLLHDLDAVRRINHVQKQKLERYSSISALNAATDMSELRKSVSGERKYASEYGDQPPMPKPASNAQTHFEIDGRNVRGRNKI